MDINSHDSADAQQILEAMRQIQDSQELQAEAASEPEKVLNRLGLSGVARHAVALALAAAVVPSAGISMPAGFWA